MEIPTFILKSATRGVSRTGIVNKANLSGRQLKNYLSFLTGGGFAKENIEKKNRSRFVTTSKGNLFLYHSTKMLDLIESRPAEKSD